MKHDNYKKAQPKAETKSDPPWETPIDPMGVRFFNTSCLSINVPLIVIYWYMIFNNRITILNKSKSIYY